MADSARRVASASGAEYYGLPIGALITQNAKVNARKQKGEEPSGASKAATNRGGNVATVTQAREAAAHASKAKPDKPKETKVKLKKPTIKGNLHFTVGSGKYTAPKGSRIYLQKEVDGLAYVKTPDGKIHVFNANGEVQTDSPGIMALLESKLSGDLTEDENFYEVEFDRAGATHDLDTIPVGTSLRDQAGTIVYTKVDEDAWFSEDLEVEVPSATVKPLYDNGDLIPVESNESANLASAFDSVEAVNFNEMSLEETATALDSMTPGAVLSVKENDVTLKKNDDGSWSSSAMTDGKTVTSSQVSFLKDSLAVDSEVVVDPIEATVDPKITNAEIMYGTDSKQHLEAIRRFGDPEDKEGIEKPQPTDRAAAAKKAREEAAAKAEEESNPYKPEPVDWSATYPENGEWDDRASLSDVEATEPGDTLLVTFFDNDEDPDHSDYFDISVFTKQEDGSWINQDSDETLTDDEMAERAESDDTEIWKSVDNEGLAPEPKDAPASDPEPADTPAPEPEVEDDPEPVIEQETTSEKKFSEFKSGDVPTGSWAATAPTGASITLSLPEGYSTDYIKNAAGEWVSKGIPIESEFFQEAIEALSKNPDRAGYTAISALDGQSLTPATIEPQDTAGIDAKYLESNGSIDKFGVLNAYPLGTTIKNSAGPEVSGITLQKTTVGWFNETYGISTPAELEVELTDKALFFVSVPPVAEQVQLSAPAEIQFLTLRDSSEMFAPAQLEQALTALENHTGPQVAYGLKKAEGNVFQNKDMQAKLRTWSKAAYPKLPPKQAALSLLREALGVPQEEHVESQGTDISLGKEGDDIKYSATGLTGGSYSAEEVKNAIAILESFEGKNFKSELSKQGNALGQLSPNEIVGFNKDKTITKQLFTDLLKEKVEAFAEAETPTLDEPAETPVEEPIVESEEEEK